MNRTASGSGDRDQRPVSGTIKPTDHDTGSAPQCRGTVDHRLVPPAAHVLHL